MTQQLTEGEAHIIQAIGAEATAELIRERMVQIGRQAIKADLVLAEKPQALAKLILETYAERVKSHKSPIISLSP